MPLSGQEPPVPRQSRTREAGVTLLEVVMVVALMAIVIATAVTGIKAMAKSSEVATFSNELNRMTYGLDEFRMINKKVPAGGSWPASLNDFIDSSLRGRYSYKCDPSTSNKVTLTTTYVFDSDPTRKLKDQKLCTNDTNTTYNADKTVTCRAVTYVSEDCS